MSNKITGQESLRILRSQDWKSRIQRPALKGTASNVSSQKNPGEGRKWFVDAFILLPITFTFVFALAYTLLTWPLIPEKIAYFVHRPASSVEAANDATPSLIDLASVLAPNRKGKTRSVSKDDVKVLSVTKSYPKTELDKDGDGLNDDAEERFYGTDPTISDSDSDGLLDGEEIAMGKSPLIPEGVSPDIEKLQNHIVIPKIDVNVPVVWSTALSEEDRLKDLNEGVIHYVETAYPGNKGNMVIAGHSSAVGWQSATYGTAFSLLDKLSPGDDIFLYYQNKVFSYKVREYTIDRPNQDRYLQYSEFPIITLISCFPIGDNSKRLYLQADLVNIGRTVAL